MTTNKQYTYFESLLQEIPAETIDLAYQVIKDAESDLNTIFGSSTFTAVLDHINYALVRAKKNEFLANPLLWEIRYTYPEEYDAALKSLQTIKETTGLQLPADEAGTLALYYFDAQESDRKLTKSYKSAELVGQIVKLIQDFFGVEFDQESVAFNRLITHLRFFVIGLADDKAKQTVQDGKTLLEEAKRLYPEAYACALQIQNLVQEELNKEVNDEELLYLTMHINRVIQ